MSQEQYIYAVARIRSRELALLDKATLEQLLLCKNYEECLKILTDKGWGENPGESAEEMLSIERKKTWLFIRELVKDMSVFDTFLYEMEQTYARATAPWNEGVLHHPMLLGVVVIGLSPVAVEPEHLLGMVLDVQDVWGSAPSRYVVFLNGQVHIRHVDLTQPFVIVGSVVFLITLDMVGGFLRLGLVSPPGIGS